MIDPQDVSDQTLSDFLEGTLRDDEAEEIQRLAESDAGLKDRLALLESILAAPMLDAIDPPQQLKDLVRSALEEIGEPDASSTIEDDAFIADPVDLEPVDVPERLEGWVREHARAAATAPETAPGAAPTLGRVNQFVATPLRLAAALLLTAGVGLLAGRGLGAEGPTPSDPNADTAKLRVELRGVREREIALGQQLSVRTRQLAQANTERALARGEADVAQVAQLELQSTLEARGRQLRRADSERARLAKTAQETRVELKAQHASSLALEQLLERSQRELERRQPELERREQEFAELEAALASSEQRNRAAETQLAQLDTPRATTAPRAAEAALLVASARRVERWDERQGWKTLRKGDKLEAGALLRGKSLNSRVALGDRRVRLGRGVYRIRDGKVEPVPCGASGTGPKTDFLALARQAIEPPAPRRTGRSALAIVAPR